MYGVKKRPTIKDLGGIKITSSDLPKDNNVRWTRNMKTIVVRAVEAGLISLDEAVGRYNLSYEEFEGWKKALAEKGPNGLKATRRRR